MEFNAYRIESATVVGIVLVAFAGGALAVMLRRTTSRRRAIWISLSAASTASVLLITLWPGRHPGTHPCQFNGSLLDWVHGNQSTANVVMMIPLAVSLPLATRRTRWHRWSFAALVALPVVIEAIQASVPLGRACDGMDVVDNWIGMTIGSCVGSTAARLARRINVRARP